MSLPTLNRFETGYCNRHTDYYVDVGTYCQQCVHDIILAHAREEDKRFEESMNDLDDTNSRWVSLMEKIEDILSREGFLDEFIDLIDEKTSDSFCANRAKGARDALLALIDAKVEDLEK